MAILLALPIFSILLILQMAVVSRMPLLQGNVDLLLITIIAWALQKRVQTAWHWCIIAGLFVSFVSGLPLGVWLVSYLLAVLLALMLRQRVWQVPLLAMFVATFFGTMIVHLLSYLTLRISGTPLPFFRAMNLITLPSVLLNLVLAIPVYAMVGDLAKWVYPEEIQM
jgi:rod shape-determining protein MreD